MCRLIYEEKRLYIHEVGGETLTTIRNCHWDHIATSVDTRRSLPNVILTDSFHASLTFYSHPSLDLYISSPNFDP